MISNVGHVGPEPHTTSNNPDNKQLHRLVSALAFVSKQKVVNADAVSNRDYFEDKFIGFRMWLWMASPFDCLPRTNYHIEGWHWRFRPTSVPTIQTYGILDVLKWEQSFNDVTINQMTSGLPPHHNRKGPTRVLAATLKTLFQSFVQGLSWLFCLALPTTPPCVTCQRYEALLLQ